MKLLFDQNISYRLIKQLDDVFVGSAQISSLGLHGATDDDIWQFAKIQDFAIVTFDADFVDIAHLNGIPPKIIWLRMGNTKTSQIANFLNLHAQIIDDFLNNPKYQHIACLELD